MRLYHQIIDFIKRKHLLRHFLLSMLVSALLLSTVVVCLKIYTKHDDNIKVPNFKSMNISMVTMVAKDNRLDIEYIDSKKYDPSYPPKSILDQNPRAGKMVKEGRKILLITNPSNYKKIKIPRITQVTLRNASSLLRSVNLEVGEVTYEDNIGKDMVLKIKYQGKLISPGDMVPKTSKIDLICGNGKRPTRSNNKVN